MSKLTKSWPEMPRGFDSSMLEIGEMMEVQEFGICNNHILLKTYDIIVSLTDPKSTWPATGRSTPRFTGRKLNPGESITLTQE